MTFSFFQIKMQSQTMKNIHNFLRNLLTFVEIDYLYRLFSEILKAFQKSEKYTNCTVYLKKTAIK